MVGTDVVAALVMTIEDQDISQQMLQLSLSTAFLFRNVPFKYYYL